MSILFLFLLAIENSCSSTTSYTPVNTDTPIATSTAISPTVNSIPTISPEEMLGIARDKLHDKVSTILGDTDFSEAYVYFLEEDITTERYGEIVVLIKAGTIVAFTDFWRMVYEDGE